MAGMETRGRRVIAVDYLNCRRRGGRLVPVCKLRGECAVSLARVGMHMGSGGREEKCTRLSVGARRGRCLVIADEDRQRPQIQSDEVVARRLGMTPGDADIPRRSQADLISPTRASTFNKHERPRKAHCSLASCDCPRLPIVPARSPSFVSVTKKNTPGPLPRTRRLMLGGDSVVIRVAIREETGRSDIAHSPW